MQIIRYEVLYKDKKGISWYRGKESGLYEYDDAIKCIKNLKQSNEYKDIQLKKITETSEIIEYSIK